MAIFEGACERVFGSTLALQSYPEYLDFFRCCAVQWVPGFFIPPLTRVPVLAHLWKLDLPPGHLKPCLLCPLLCPLARIPWGGARRFALAMAGCPMLPATSSSPRPCAQVAERSADGLHRWRLLALHFRWRARAAPRRRGSARAEP